MIGLFKVHHKAIVRTYHSSIIHNSSRIEDNLENEDNLNIEDNLKGGSFKAPKDLLDYRIP